MRVFSGRNREDKKTPLWPEIPVHLRVISWLDVGVREEKRARHAVVVWWSGGWWELAKAKQYAMVARIGSMYSCYDSYSYRLWSLANVWSNCQRKFFLLISLFCLVFLFPFSGLLFVFVFGTPNFFRAEESENPRFFWLILVTKTMFCLILFDFIRFVSNVLCACVRHLGRLPWIY